ncbi:MerR family transcriptional regulator, partial [Blastomonas sp.]|uniref:MerR family transcriptional regulator n=1 Tax=Blastomonas sp. TaxID=1909299 RepID=UPI0035945105
MNIGAAAGQSGLSSKTIRYYEDIGLLTADRAANGYRDYSNEGVYRLRFVQRSRSLGFSIEERRKLLSLYTDRDRASADVKAIATEKLGEIDRHPRRQIPHHAASPTPPSLRWQATVRPAPAPVSRGTSALQRG